MFETKRYKKTVFISLFGIDYWANSIGSLRDLFECHPDYEIYPETWIWTETGSKILKMDVYIWLSSINEDDILLK